MPLLAPASFLPELVSPVPKPMLSGLGTAEWVWTKDGRKPTAFSMNAAVLQFFACGERTASSDEPCNGFDDDRDGVVDEEHPDADGDGIADCVDGENLCDGKDDDGDGFIEEGFGDVDFAGIFVQIGLVPNTDWLKGTLALSKYGEIEIEIDAKGHTSVPGIFAAGDATTTPFKQIVIAMGDGAKAALGAFEHLIRLGVATPAGGVEQPVAKAA